jgi:hypothetical protein
VTGCRQPTETRSLCPYCGVGCGLLVETARGRLRGVAGDPLYPVNHGRTCRKPLELASAVHAADRATVTPLMRADQDSRFEPAGWDQALGSLAGRLQAIAAEHGPDALGFYISGQLLTEDYYVVGKLVKGFLGTNNLDSNSRLCMSSAVAGYMGAFGSDGPPGAYCRHRARRLLPAARIEHRGVPSDRVVADPRSPARGGVRDLRRSAAHSDRARRGSAPARPPGQRPGPARLDARGDRGRGPARRAVHRAAHDRLRSGHGGRARMAPGTSRRGLWHAGRADRRGGAALRRRADCARDVVDGRQSVDRRDAQESRADQPLPGDRQSRPPRLRAAVPDRAAKRDGRPRDGRARAAPARLPQRRRAKPTARRWPLTGGSRRQRPGSPGGPG